MKVESVDTEDYPLEFSWLWLASTVMQKTLPTEFKSEEVESAFVAYVSVCVIAVVLHCLSFRGSI